MKPFALISLIFSLAAAAAPSRYDEALESAAIRQTTLADLGENSLIIGNGDINGLLHAGANGSLQLRLTKNDVWDARMDTSGDPELAVIDPATHKITKGGYPSCSWKKPYPCPLACGVLEFASAGAGKAWRPIRAEGKTNAWSYDGKLATMSLEGRAGASCGWQMAVASDDKVDKVRLRLSGTANARHYLDVVTTQGRHIESGWKDTPTTEQDLFFDLPAGTGISQILLYAWTKDGAPAENRYAAIELQGTNGNQALDLASATPPAADYRLEVKRAIATVPGKGKGSQVAVRAQADRNVFVIEGDTTVALKPATATFIPKAETGTRDGVEYLLQPLPADPGYPEKGDWAGMSFAVAKAAKPGRTVVAIVTSIESKQPLEEAIKLAQTTLAESTGDLRRQHERLWDDFWSASRIDLADTYLRDTWYRNLYFMRCISKAGVKPVGLFAGLFTDFPAWHGDFHLNYNAQQTYWGWYGCNHAELSQPYEWLIKTYLPRARWLAKQTYDCGGAHFAHTVFMYEPADPAACKSKNGRQMVFIPYTYTLGDTGWAVQNHWLHYKHYPDRQLLETEAYPLVKAAAEFYADFAGKCQVNAATGKVVFGPTYSPEHWSLGRDDGTCDIAFARMALKAAIEGAGVLNVDAPLAVRWQQTLDKLPDYPRTAGENPVVVDVAGAPPITYNVPVPALPVYPAGEITWFSPEAERQLFSRTIDKMKSNGNNDMIILAGARARLSMPDAYSWTRAQFQIRQRPNGTLSIAPRGGGFNGMGHFTEDFAAAGVITEMLLQGVGDTIRIFPAWPKDQDAAFENLRAQGGFLVSAEQKAGQVVKLEIASTIGGKLRLLDPWSGKITEHETQPGKKLLFTDKGTAP
jgi:hypothetical protein